VSGRRAGAPPPPRTHPGTPPTGVQTYRRAQMARWLQEDSGKKDKRTEEYHTKKNARVIIIIVIIRRIYIYIYTKTIKRKIPKRSENYPKTIRKLSENYPKTIRKRSENYPKTIRKRSENNQKTITKLSENYNQTIRKR
jgi:hypothetical protein